MINIEAIDHLVLTVKDLNATCKFYERALGMEVITFGDNRKALRFDNYKINLHLHGKEITPHAAQPTPGSADLCFIIKNPVEEALSWLEAQQITIEEGIVERKGAQGKIKSLYLRDPDYNLIELSNYIR